MQDRNYVQSRVFHHNSDTVYFDRIPTVIVEFEKEIFLILSNFLSPEKLTQNKLSNFAELQFLNDKLAKNTNFVKLTSANGILLHFVAFSR